MNKNDIFKKQEVPRKDKYELGPSDLSAYGIKSTLYKPLYGVDSKDHCCMVITNDKKVLKDRLQGMKVMTKEKDKTIRSLSFLNFDSMVSEDMRKLIAQYAQDHISKEVYDRILQVVKNNLESKGITVPNTLVGEVYQAIREGFLSDISYLYSIPVVLNKANIFNDMDIKDEVDMLLAEQYFVIMEFITMSLVDNEQAGMPPYLRISYPVFKHTTVNLIGETDYNYRTAFHVGNMIEKVLIPDCETPPDEFMTGWTKHEIAEMNYDSYIRHESVGYLKRINEIDDKDCSIINIYEFEALQTGETFESYTYAFLDIYHGYNASFDAICEKGEELGGAPNLGITFPIMKSIETLDERYWQEEDDLINMDRVFGGIENLYKSLTKCAFYRAPYGEEPRIFSAPAYKSIIHTMTDHNEYMREWINKYFNHDDHYKD